MKNEALKKKYNEQNIYVVDTGAKQCEGQHLYEKKNPNTTTQKWIRIITSFSLNIWLLV